MFRNDIQVVDGGKCNDCWYLLRESLSSIVTLKRAEQKAAGGDYLKDSNFPKRG